MQRRNFLKGLVAFAAAPISALTPVASPAKTDNPLLYLKRDIFFSEEAMNDIKNWGIDQIDELTMSQIYGCPEEFPKDKYVTYTIPNCGLPDEHIIECSQEEWFKITADKLYKKPTGKTPEPRK